MSAAADIRTHYRLCPFCEQNCGVKIEADHKTHQIISVRGDKDDPFSRGYICPKAYAMKALHEDPDILKQPMIRKNGTLQPASWEEALDFAASRLAEIKAKHGPNAIGIYFGNPLSHIPAPIFYLAGLITELGTTQIYSAASVDHNPQLLTMMAMYGAYSSFPVPDIDRVEYFVLVGTNPLASNGSLMTAPGVPRRLEALQARGGTVVVIDPRRTETAEMADWHLPIKPDGDAWLMFALVHVLFAEGLVRCDALAPRLKGLETLRALAAAFPPEAVEARTGLAASDIRKLARALAAAPSACIYGRVGTTIQAFGSLTNWLMQCINILTGNLDRVGGLMFPRGVFRNIVQGERYRDGVAPYARWRSRVSGAPEIASQIPMSVFAEEIETPGEGQIKALVTVCGNPSLSCPNDSGRLDAALDRLDFMLSFDIYVNETTRHADVILPSADHMSRSEFPVYFVPFMVRDYIKWSPEVFAPEPGTWLDQDIYCGLLARFKKTSPEACEAEAIRFLYEQLKADDNPVLRNLSFEQVLGHLGDEPGPDRMFDLLVRSGPHGDQFGARPDGLTLERLKAHPHGVDMGPMQPGMLDAMLHWPDGKIDLAPALIVGDVERLRAEAEDTPETLRLIGRRHVRSNNSWMHNLHVLTKGPERCTLLIHPHDAEDRGIADGAMVEVESKSGRLLVKAELTDAMRRGVVSLPHGWGHDAPGVQTRIAAARPGVNLNFIAETSRTDAPSHNAAFNGVRVAVRAAALA